MDAGFSLVKKKIGETEYGIGWLPMGGYVKIAGMIDESMDKEQLKQEPQPWEYRSKPAWQRLIIIMGGVIVNFFLAWIIYIFLFLNHGDNFVDNSKITHGIAVDSVGKLLGLRNGDKILKVDGKPQAKFDQLPLEILFGDNITVEREGAEVTFDLSDEGKRDVIKRAGKNFLSAREEIIIDSIVPGRPADIAGLKKGDKIEFSLSIDTLAKMGVLQLNEIFKTKDIVLGRAEILDVFTDVAKVDADYKKETETEKKREVDAIKAHLAKNKITAVSLDMKFG